MRAEATLAHDALPVERLAAAVGALPSDPSRLDECIALLGDGLSGGLLYREVEAVLFERLEQALPRLDAGDRLALVAALARIRLLESEHLVRYVRFGLDARGLAQGGDPYLVRDTWSVAHQRAIYLWSDAMRSATVLQQREIAELLDERGIHGDGGHVWDVFMAFLGYRGTVLVTPRQSPSVRHELEQMQRHDWLDMPWMFGAPGTTFVIDEVEDDSSPET